MENTIRLRNIIMIIAVLLCLFSAITLYHNIWMFIIFIVLAVICFVLAIKELQRYMLSQYLDKQNFKEISTFLLKRNSASFSERNTLINALIWAGDYEQLDAFAKNNALVLPQEISYIFYLLDKHLFEDKNNNECESLLERVENLLSAYVSSSFYNKDNYDRFLNYLSFYKNYLNSEYEEAIKAIEQIKDDKVVSLWKLYHKGIIFSIQNDKKQADECFEVIRNASGSIRFKKWLGEGENATKKKTYSFLPAILVGEIALAVALILSQTKKYSSIEEALRWQRNIKFEENTLVSDELKGKNGVAIYIDLNNVFYCDYRLTDGKYSVKNVYVDKMISGLNDNEGFLSAAKLIQVDTAFYKKVTEKDNEVILTESDQIGSLDGTPEVKDIKAISINGKNYYLVYLEIGR